MKRIAENRKGAPGRDNFVPAVVEYLKINVIKIGPRIEVSPTKLLKIP